MDKKALLDELKIDRAAPVAPDLLVLGLVWAVALGAFGGLFPAVRAARVPITVALRGE